MLKLQKIFKLGDDLQPTWATTTLLDKFYLFLFVALIPWLFFSASLTGGSIAIISEENLVKKVYFPRQILPIAYVTTAFVNMLLCFIVIFAVLFIVGLYRDWETKVYIISCNNGLINVHRKPKKDLLYLPLNPFLTKLIIISL